MTKKLEASGWPRKGNPDFPRKISSPGTEEESCKDRGCRSGTYHGWMRGRGTYNLSFHLFQPCEMVVASPPRKWSQLLSNVR